MHSIDKVHQASSCLVCMQVAGPSSFNWASANRSDPWDDSKGPAQLTKGDILAAADASLRRLQTDYIDLYQLHWPSRYIPVFGNKQYNPENVRECVGFEEQVLSVLRMHAMSLASEISK